MSDVEVTERITAALRNIDFIVNPVTGVMVVFAEDKQRELPGKTYVIYWETNLQKFRDAFEGNPQAIEPTDFGPRNIT